MNNKFLADKIAVVGGGSKGLGFGCARELVKAGAKVVLCARNAEALEKAKLELVNLGGECQTIVADLGIVDDNHRIVENTILSYGKIDILINNSGGPRFGTYSNFSDIDWFNAFQNILMYNIRMTSLVAEEMKKNGWGRIINIASLSVKEPVESLVLSNVFRAGVVAFAKSISKELLKTNITVNCILPGAFKTDRATALILQSAQATGRSPDDIESENISRLPLGRYQEPGELGALVAFLCSDAASGITGSTISIDGGISNCLF